MFDNIRMTQVQIRSKENHRIPTFVDSVILCLLYTPDTSFRRSVLLKILILPEHASSGQSTVYLLVSTRQPINAPARAGPLKNLFPTAKSEIIGMIGPCHLDLTFAGRSEAERS